MKRSHLTRHLQNQAKRNIVTASIGILIIVVLVIIYGPSFIIGMSTLTGKQHASSDSPIGDDSVSYVAPPVLEDVPEATNSAKVIISGSAEANARVFLSVNGKEVGGTTAHSNRSFVFHDVTLKQGSNEIKAKATVKDKDSEYSSPVNITYSNKAPSLSVDSPSDGQSFPKEQNPIKVSGKSDPNVKVTVNDFWATIDAQGQYSYMLNLHGGDNQIKVIAVDEAGNKTEKDLKVTYSQ